MKKLILLSALMSTIGLSMAQEVQTYSVYDTNQSNTIEVDDVTSVVEQVKNDVVASNTQQYVTAEDLNTVLQQIQSELAAIRSHIGLPDPNDANTRSYASFACTRKSLHIGDTFSQQVKTASNGSVSYFSTNPAVASVDASSGLVSAVAIGETTIVATVAASADYPVASAAYAILVEPANLLNGHEFVDLGLPSGLKWASCNVGANKPESKGEYFAWGEITTKETFCRENYIYCNCVPQQTYVDDDGFEVTIPAHTEYIDIGNDISATQYDVAYMTWGEQWHMPTAEDFRELCDNCTFTQGTKNGVSGYKVKGPNNNWIFFPVVNYFNEDGNGGGGAIYISSTIIDYNGSPIWMQCQSSRGCITSFIGDTRYFGFAVRPVCQ